MEIWKKKKKQDEIKKQKIAIRNLKVSLRKKERRRENKKKRE